LATTEVQSGYAPAGELEMYYEIHGSGRPLVLLHGAYMTIDLMGPILPRLAGTRQVIAPEQQGHGRTGRHHRPAARDPPSGARAQARGRVRRLRQSGMLDRSEWLLAMIAPFLDAADPD
jgi:pimeloyl-ACP methyl ester carboxylesterase